MKSGDICGPVNAMKTNKKTPNKHQNPPQNNNTQKPPTQPKTKLKILNRMKKSTQNRQK